MRQFQMRNKAVHLQRITMQQYKFFILRRSRPFCFQRRVQHRHRDRLVFVPPQNCAVAYCQFQFLIVILRNKALYFRQQNFTDADAFRLVKQIWYFQLHIAAAQFTYSWMYGAITTDRTIRQSADKAPVSPSQSLQTRASVSR